MRSIRSLVLAASIAAASPVTALAQPAPTDRHRQVDAIFAPWSLPGAPGCAVGISRDGALDYARGYGMSNLEYDLPIAADSVFQSASISKQFTAFAIGLLAQEGRLSLDDDIRRYVPEIPDHGKTITLAHLIHHTGGLREQGQLLNLAGWRGDDLYTEADILWALSRQRRANFAAGSEVVYGNAAYTLLGIVVQRVSGQSLRAFADARIFQPLGMADTQFRDDHTQVMARRASAYSPREGGGWRISVPNIDHYGSTSLHTSVGDLLKWQQNLIDARVGGRTLIDWMQTSGKLDDGTLTQYGAGLRLAGYRGLRMISHDGADGGYRSDMLLFPDQRVAIAVLCNGSPIVPDQLTRKIAELYLGDRMTAPALAPAVARSDADPASLAGVYWSRQTDEVVRLEFKDGALRQVGVAAAFVPIGGNDFRPGEQAQHWRFVPATNATPAQLHIKDFWPTARSFVRVDAALPDATALAAFAGRYRSEDTDMTYTVRAVDGKLVLSWPRQFEVALEAVGGERFVGSRGLVTFVRNADGGVDGFTISNRRLRRLQALRIAATDTAQSLPSQATGATAQR